MTETFNPQANTVFCRKYQQELPKMPHPPFPNKKGQELQETVSEKAWKEWLEQQTMLINENHLSMLDRSAVGPTKVNPASSIRSANSAFSAKKP